MDRYGRTVYLSEDKLSELTLYLRFDRGVANRPFHDYYDHRSGKLHAVHVRIRCPKETIWLIKPSHDHRSFAERPAQERQYDEGIAYAKQPIICLAPARH